MKRFIYAIILILLLPSFVLADVHHYYITDTNNECDLVGYGASYPPSTIINDNTQATTTVEKDLIGGTYTVVVPVIRFDTTSIPSNAVITSAQLEFKTQYINTTATVNCEYYGWASPLTNMWTTTVGSTAFSVNPNVFSSYIGTYKGIVLSNASANIAKGSLTSFRMGLVGGQPATPEQQNSIGFYPYNGTPQDGIRLLVDYTIPNIPPDAISSTTITDNTLCNHNSFSWGTPAGTVTHYTIVANSVDLADVIPVGTNTFTHAGLTEGTLYAYYIKAWNVDVYSITASSINITTPTISKTKSVASTNELPPLRTRVKVNWTPITNAKNYYITRSDTGISGTYNLIYNDTGTSYTYNDTTATIAGFPYYYKILPNNDSTFGTQGDATLLRCGWYQGALFDGFTPNYGVSGFYPDRIMGYQK
jgi:hypothetical protein